VVVADAPAGEHRGRSLYVSAVGGRRPCASQRGWPATPWTRIIAADGLEKIMVALETGVRGYVITGQERFLRPWNRALASVPGGRWGRWRTWPATTRTSWAGSSGSCRASRPRWGVRDAAGRCCSAEPGSARSVTATDEASAVRDGAEALGGFDRDQRPSRRPDTDSCRASAASPLTSDRLRCDL